ncbi:MAG: hypothetical protein I8H98_09365 [Moraxellaceae bacterium]|uniref:Uncharacterized protein n=1 Tax=Acinetobacter tjernbergiae DSM 14971 = CIP 107465 TaxID=1120928 RepID=V2UZP9_9GAMM|nr:hypothetical protein [Acinetobacter tjernbergiae]ESK54096.1 hypothetical protein F990_02968 [Acinetobacter tjernbergiae DSM 14971 = CIP 107465]MBH2002455.1 hypothetical protein [Moraxellaceae bacterium]MBH2029892.1 hypothetical protein [Moraxellaceae bacterium]
MQFRLFLQHFSVGILFSFGLSACDSHHPESMKQPTQAQPNGEEVSAPNVSDDEKTISSEGVALTEVAGQATIPHVASNHMTKPTQQDLRYAGRYHARIPCTDAFAGCVKGEKEAEYILNLLEDGSVYWTNTSFGRLGADPSRNIAKIEQTCKQVQWHVHTTGKKIMVRCEAADLNLYYQISQNHDLVLDLDQIWNADHGRNRKFFKEYPFPQQAYIFEKVK